MADPSFDLQTALYTRLVAQCPAVDGRFYDKTPQNVVFPYVNGIGGFQVIDDGADCIDATEVFGTLHAWSRVEGKGELQIIASQVRSALHEVELDLGPDWDLVLIEHRSTNYLDDPDGVTTHAVIVFRAQIDAR